MCVNSNDHTQVLDLLCATCLIDNKNIISAIDYPEELLDQFNQIYHKTEVATINNSEILKKKVENLENVF